MQYAIISDIHANLQAWNAILLDIRSLGIDEIICLGDIVGYGPNPAKVLQSVHSNVNHFVLGNHDAVICGKMDDSLFNDNAQKMIQWTQANLNKNAIKFLRTVPLSLSSDTFRCAHGDFSDPASFNYIIDPEDASASWQAVEENLLFVGHTHEPSIFILGQSRIPRKIKPQDFVIEPEKRFIVNVGSVGQPRDGVALAGYCIYDTLEESVCWRRIPFDIDAYSSALEKANVPADTNYFLNNDPRIGNLPLREILNFTPARYSDQKVQDTIEVQEITFLQRKITKWKILSIAAALFILLSITASMFLWVNHNNRELTLKGQGTEFVSAANFRPNNNILTIPKTDIPTGQAIQGWTIKLGSKATQSLQFEKKDPSFILNSLEAKDEITLSSPNIIVQPGMKFCMEGMFRKSNDFTGNIVMFTSLTKRAESGKEIIDQFAVKEPNWLQKDGNLLAKKTFALPADSYSIQLHIRGKFSGETRIKDLKLYKK